MSAWCTWHDNLATECGGVHEGEDPRVTQPCPGKVELGWRDHTFECMFAIHDLSKDQVEPNCQCPVQTDHLWEYKIPGMTDRCILCEVRCRR